MNQKVKNLIQKLGEAIHESVTESEDIAGVVKNIREQGFDVLLMLEATIGLNEVEAEDEETSEAIEEDTDGPFTRNDVTFLKSLRITLTEDEVTGTQDDISDTPRHHLKPDSNRTVQTANILTRPEQSSAGPHFFAFLPFRLRISTSHGRLAFLCCTFNDFVHLIQLIRSYGRRSAVV